jgi:hypothetical protein
MIYNQQERQQKLAGKSIFFENQEMNRRHDFNINVTPHRLLQ